jgi:hypothetical protein
MERMTPSRIQTFDLDFEDAPRCSHRGSGSAVEECVLNHPHADIILRSSDSREFRVPRIYIIDSSPVLAALIQASIPDISNS